jgi:diguanylate cyclase (GGDEF)-like protein
VSIRVAPIRDAEGHITGATELFSDNGAVRHLREQIAGLRRLALLDPLTNLPNRRFLEAQIDAHLALLGRQSIPFGFLFADIDHFKRFNDTYGHEVGDAALRTVAATLRGCMRPFDSIGRWGGEEFAGILANCDVPESQRIAERLCALVRQSRIRVAHRTDLAVTVSIGVTRGKPGDSGQSLVARGDALMYRSKELGRDRVTADAD